MAPQFTGTKGPAARAEDWWMARATSSLPVPDSPVTITGAMLRETLSTSIRTWFMAGEFPTRRAISGRNAADGGSTRTTGTGRWACGGGGDCPSAAATTERNCRRSTGLVR